MLAVIDLLFEMRQRGVSLWVEKGQLHYQARRGALSADDLEQIRAQKAAIIEAVSQSAMTLPLSPAQQAVWACWNCSEYGAGCAVSVVLRMSGDLACEVIERCVSNIVWRQESLRSRFIETDTAPRQVIETVTSFAVRLADLEYLQTEHRTLALPRLLQRESSRAFDLAVAPLFRILLVRISKQEHIFSAVFHPLIADAWSAKGIFPYELAQLYAAAVQRVPASLVDLPLRFSDYARRQANSNSVASPKTPAHDGARGEVLPFSWPAAVSRDVYEISRTEEIPPSIVFLTAFKLLLAHWRGEERVSVVVPWEGRAAPGVDRLIGRFEDLVMLSSDLSAQLSFREAVRRVGQVALEAMASGLPAFRGAERMGLVAGEGGKPLPVLAGFIPQQCLFEPLRLQTSYWSVIGGESGLRVAPVSLFIRQEKQSWAGEFEISRELSAEIDTERFLANWIALLEVIVADPNRLLGELPMIAQEKAARAPLEEKLRRIWSEVLRVDNVELEDSFFDLGGNSIQMAVLADLINRRLKLSLKVLDLFRHPTVSQLAGFIREGIQATYDRADLEQRARRSRDAKLGRRGRRA